MAKTTTDITTLKINRGTYAKIQENLTDIGENELIITTDKNIPVPQVADANKIVGVDANGDYELKTGVLVTQAMYDYLDDVSYQAPAVLSFIMKDNNNVAIPLTIETGVSLSSNRFTHYEKNIANVVGRLSIKKLVSGVWETINPNVGASATEATNIVNTTTFNNTITFRLTGVDTKGNTFYKDYTITFVSYVYYITTDQTIVANDNIAGATKSSVVGTFASSGANISYSSGDYVYIFTHGTGKTIEQYVMGQWVALPTTYVGKVNLTQSNSYVAEYDCYKVGAFNASGEDKFRC